MTKTTRFRIVDALLLAMAVLPFVGCIVLKILFTPETEGITVAGPLVYLRWDIKPQPLYITEATVVSAAVMIAIVALCLFMTHGLSVECRTKRQLIAEMIVEKVTDFVTGNMGMRFVGFAPFVAAILALSALSSLSSLLGLYPPTSDINIVAGWAILVFILMTYYKLKGGVGHYLKSFGDPIPIFYPFNVFSEVATPLSMTFRHYGNILSGGVITALIGAALAGLSSIILGSFSNAEWYTTYIASIPFLRVGLPAILSIYFDVFSGCLQAFIFAMLTMLNISGGYPEEAVAARAEKRRARRDRRLAKRTAKRIAEGAGEATVGVIVPPSDVPKDGQ